MYLGHVFFIANKIEIMIESGRNSVNETKLAIIIILEMSEMSEMSNDLQLSF